MRECRRNFAHGPMRLTTKKVKIEYKNKIIECEKTFYACDFCDFELHEKWMEDKLMEQLESLYNKKYRK